MNEKKNLGYYEILGLQKGASSNDIKTAFRTLAKKYHPDKAGGDAEKFKLISQASNVLQDPQLRAIYDKDGIIDQTLMNQNQQPNQQQPNTIINVSITLEELFLGKNKTVSFEWERVCRNCINGCEKGLVPITCHKCQGKGLVYQTRQLGLGMIQQISSICADCNGKGVSIRKQDQCQKCQGKRLVKTNETVTLEIITNQETGDSHLNLSSKCIDDIIRDHVKFNLIELPHTIYKRQGPHLIMDLQILLIEALTGLNKYINYINPNQPQIYIKTPQKTILNPNSKLKLKSFGITKNGHLLININILFPTHQQISQYTHTIKLCLPPPTINNNNNNNNTVETEENKNNLEIINETDYQKLTIISQPASNIFNNSHHQQFFPFNNHPTPFFTFSF